MKQAPRAAFLVRGKFEADSKILQSEDLRTKDVVF